MYKVLNFIHVKKFFSFINKEMEGDLNDLNFKILERIEKETNQIIDWRACKILRYKEIGIMEFL